MEEQAEECGAVTHAKGGSAQNSAGDALKDSGWSHAAETVEDKSVGDIEYADEKSGSGDDLPESGPVRGYCHLE